jgi:hypothetical protein
MKAKTNEMCTSSSRNLVQTRNQIAAGRIGLMISMGSSSVNEAQRVSITAIFVALRMEWHGAETFEPASLWL